MTNRDGNLTSLWQDKARDFTSTLLPTERHYDVAIAGGGITGITTALLLQQSGKSCIVLESRSLCFGTTGGTTAHLNTFLDTPYPKLIKNFGKDAARTVARATREGYGGNGITHSQIAALTLRARLMTGEERYEGIFKPGRIKPVAGLPKFVQHNAGVAKQLLRKMIGLDELEGLDRLRPGEGAVVRLHDEKIAVCRDSNGMLHAVNPKCTHMGCTVVWNKAEQTWDCPCHGARYSMEGKVVNGPADKDLEQIILGEPVKGS